MEEHQELTAIGPFKYKIHEQLNQMTHLQYKLAIRELPGLIGKCMNTFRNYSRIPLDSQEMLPYDVGILIERYFKLPPGTLSNVL